MEDIFTRDELLKISTCIDDADILKKINATLYTNEAIINALVLEFQNKGLLKIEKDDCKDEYYVHLLEEECDSFDIIEICRTIEFKNKTNVTCSNIFPITHPDAINMWWHKEMIQAWTREDLTVSTINK